MKTPHQIAAEIHQVNEESIGFLRTQLRRAYELVNTAGAQQQIIDALPDLGLVPVHVFGTYGIFRAALATIGRADGVPDPSPEVYVIDPATGAITYVEPPAPVLPEPVVFPEL